MRESVFAASGFSLVSLWFQAEKGTLSPLECLSFANTIQADLPTCDLNALSEPISWSKLKSPGMEKIFFKMVFFIPGPGERYLSLFN